MNNSNAISNNIFDVEPKKTNNIFEMPTDNSQNTNNDNNIFSNLDEVETEEKLIEIEKDKKIERIQIALILILVVVGSLVYFFGYDFLKPFIKVD